MPITHRYELLGKFDFRETSQVGQRGRRQELGGGKGEAGVAITGGAFKIQAAVLQLSRSALISWFPHPKFRAASRVQRA